MQKEFDAKIEVLVEETAKMRKMRMDFKKEVVHKISQIEDIVGDNAQGD